MEAALTQLITQLQADSPEARREAAEKLCRLGAEAQPAALALVGASGDADEETAEWATAALEELGAPDPEHTGELGRLLAAPNPDVSYWAATLLGRLGPPAAAAVPALVTALTQHEWLPTRERAAWSLGKIGPAAQAAQDALVQASQSSEARLARLAATALQEIASS